MRNFKIRRSKPNGEENDVMKMYFNDLNGEKTITAEEEAILARQIRNNDQTAFNKLVRSNLKFVISVAKQYKNRNIPLNDLINEGNIGLIKAAHKFDEKKGFKFISYAVWWIRQSILQAINKHSKIVRIPTNKIDHYNQIRRTFLEFEQEHEREPSPEEIAEILEQKPEDIYNTLHSEVSDISLDRPPEGDEEEETSLYETVANSAIEDTDHRMAFKESLRFEIMRALKTLEEREMEVIKMSFGLDYDHAMNFEEIGNKLGVTRERVRQIRIKALDKLKNGNTRELLVAFCSR